jgi:hypothetical protein
MEKKFEYNETVHQLGGAVLYHILIEFGAPMELLRLIKMCLNETYSIVRTGKHLFDTFPVQNSFKLRRCFMAIFVNFALEYAVSKVQEIQMGLKLSGTHQLLGHTDAADLLRDNINTTKNTEALIDASKDVGLEENTEKIKYILMFRNQSARQNNIKINNRPFENVANFKCLGTTVTYRNLIHEEIKSRLNSGNACYHSVRIGLSSRLLSKSVKIKI